MMDNKEIFKGVINPSLRAILKRNLLSLKVTIPSLTTFYNNIKYFNIGVKILRTYIIKEEDAVKGEILFKNLARH
ncbi:hypothetical protein QBC46DRAFT_259712 [Diplogelasinospora grovesii]|uniref:Uncharacterized protein n=1 Tax=Diplogelasinospora grovesii TaxID=303347 RepID=A0AAN6N8B5_9PEZI|nr:hypothetical protein QBC46DRAFT_259712 [Diplogelasinospora grovesii]